MARLYLNNGQSFGIVGAGLATDVYGTLAGAETVTVAADGDAIFQPDFNAGGDTINILGNAALYTAAVSGSNLVLTSVAGANIVIPFGSVGTSIVFADASARVLKVSGASLLLGSQTIATTGSTAVAAGSGGATPPPPPSSGDATTMEGVDTDKPYLMATYELTSSTDTVNGTSGGDTIRAGKAQNPAVGGVSNTLASADRIFGGGGLDHLFAVVVPEFFSGTAGFQVDIQPIIRSVERIEIEASDAAVSGGATFDEYSGPMSGDAGSDVVTLAGLSSQFVNQIIIVDGKDMRDVDHIGSFNSDGDLVIENLNTLTSANHARNTEDITITMDHTDNFDSDHDASDLHVYFDDDYLLAGQSRTRSQANYWLLDEDSPNYITKPLENIERNGVTFTINGTPVTLTVATTSAGVPDTWEGFAAALQADINAKIALGNTVLTGLTVVVDFNNTDQTFNDLGAQVTIPAITILDAQGRTFTNLGFISPADATGAFDIYGRVDTDPSDVFDNPITVKIELNKVGRNGYGGDLVVGGKNGDEGIEVFRVSVEGVGDKDPSGAVSKPSNLGTLASTGGDLAEVYIVTAPEFANGTTFASLTIRDGFGDCFQGWDNPSVPMGSDSLVPRDLRLVDATGFKGDLTLGNMHRVVDLDTLIATGGGNVQFFGRISGYERNQPYSYTTGKGDDLVDLKLDGDGLDYAQSAVKVVTGDGKDTVIIKQRLDEESSSNNQGNPELINQAILRNVSVDTGNGDDKVYIGVGGNGNTIINTGSGNDSIFSDNGDCDYAAWAFNFDYANQPNPSNDEDLTGVGLKPMYLMGATVRVSLSGAGGGIGAGGGVMAFNNPNADGAGADAVQSDGYSNGYESSVVISSLISGRRQFGDQRDINAAVLKAINEHPRMSQLIHAEIRENNTLVVYSLTSGEFTMYDLEITIDQANWQSTQQGDDVVLEARQLTSNSALTHTDVWGVSAAQALADSSSAKPNYQLSTSSGNALLGPREGDYNDTSDPSTDPNPVYAAELNSYYRGAGVDQAYQLWGGAASSKETDNVITPGTGDDLVVLSTDARGSTPPSMLVSSGNALLNWASNETIVYLNGDNGNNWIMNFQTALRQETVGSIQSPTFMDRYEAGTDFLNFLSMLDSREDMSVNTSSEPDSDVSHKLIAVTLDYAPNTPMVASTLDGAPANQHNANEVVFVRFMFDPSKASQTWAGLGAAQVQALYNTALTTKTAGTASASDYGNLDDINFMANDEYDNQASLLATGVDPLTNTAKGILAVENGANLGEYKFFYLTWDGNSTADGTTPFAPDTSDYDGQVTATLIATEDFGTSLDGIHEINLVGSATYNALIRGGWSAVAP